MTEPSCNSNLSGSCFERYPGFVLIRYGKRRDTGTDFERYFQEGGACYAGPHAEAPGSIRWQKECLREEMGHAG